MILVVGGTGTIGSEVVKQLSAKKLPFKVLSRSLDKAKKLGSGTPVQGDYSKPETLPAALQGVDQVIVIPVVSPQLVQHHRNLVDAAKKAGVKHIVKVSVAGADAPGPAPLAKLHRESEQVIEGSGISWTHLRPGVFMSNWRNLADSVKKEGVVYQPTGQGKVAPIHPADIAEAAIVAVTQNGHANKAYVLTGSQPLSYQEQADLLSGVIGKPVKHVDVPAEAGAKAMLSNGMPDWLVDSLSKINAGVRAGQMAFVSPDLEKLLGHKARTLKQWFEENAGLFR